MGPDMIIGELYRTQRGKVQRGEEGYMMDMQRISHKGAHIAQFHMAQ